MAMQSPTLTRDQVSSHISFIKSHKDQIRQTLGPQTGTTFGAKESFSPDDVRRLAQSLNCSAEQAEAITALWPVYQLGYEDAQKNSGSQGSSSSGGSSSRN